MFFKSLEINGFKSFGTKTKIEFQPGVTVIVGPNGCGKSNVFDSIRWALGEQNARHLRGTRMTDIIFAGSASLKALGAAQVSVTVNNEGRYLPIDFEEVNITRRLFADGQSEYFLNKTPCRLKDITDLFLDTGIGSQGYSVMEQGNVDAIINSKPMERRILFEDAAGVSRYKARRSEALRKLERADADFIRLTDLIAEVRRQTNSLKRQASKAERFKRLTHEAKAVERRLLGVRYEKFQKRLQERTREHNSLQDKFAALAARIADLEVAQEKGHDAEAELNEQLKTLRARQFEIVGEIERREHNISLLKERLSEGERRQEQLAAEAEAASREEMAAALELGRAKAEMAENEERIAELEEVLAEMREEFEDMRSGREEALESLNALRRELAQLQEKKSQAENAVRLSRALVQRLDEQIENGDRRNDELRQGLESLEARADEYARRQAEAEALLQAKADEIERLNRASEEAGREAEVLRQDMDQVERRLNEVRSKLKVLEDLESSYQGYYQGVKAVMLASDQRQLHGIVGIVAQLVHSPAEYEMAIEAALGGSVQDIVVRKAEDARSAVQFLKSSNLGRATFLPLDLLEVRRPNQTFHEALRKHGVLGAAAALVKYDPDIDTAVQFLLGTTIIAETLDRSIQLEREGLRQRYVSLDGQIVSPQGSIAGGSVRASGLLSREREIRELRDLGHSLAVQWESMRKKAEDLRQSLKDGQLRITALREEMHATRVEIAELGRDRNACLTSMDERRKSLEDYDANRQKWLDETHVHKQAIDDNEELARGVQAELTNAEAALSKKQGEMALQDTQVDALAGSLSELRVEMASLRERADRLLSRSRRLASRQWQLVHEQVRRRQEKEAILARHAGLLKEIGDIRGSLGEQFDSRRAAEREIALLEQDRQALFETIQSRLQALHTLQGDRNQLQNDTQDAAIAKKEVEVQIEQLRQTAQEKFECEIEQIDQVQEMPALASSAEVAAEGDEPVEELPPVDLSQLTSEDALYGRWNEINNKLNSMGPVNLSALEDYENEAARLEFLLGQEKDLNEARRQLTETIAEIDETTKVMFKEAFESIRINFIEMFRRLFGGGKADLVLTEVEGGDPLLEGGVDIIAQPPGKKLQNISLLSGGEKALTAVSLLFGIFMHRPSPFCVLDEIDAPLDDNNIERFKNLLLEFAKQTQFIIITHNKQTMALADTIYGVTMEEAGVSKLVAVRFDESLSLVG